MNRSRKKQSPAAQGLRRLWHESRGPISSIAFHLLAMLWMALIVSSSETISLKSVTATTEAIPESIELSVFELPTQPIEPVESEPSNPLEREAQSAATTLQTAMMPGSASPLNTVAITTESAQTDMSHQVSLASFASTMRRGAGFPRWSYDGSRLTDGRSGALKGSLLNRYGGTAETEAAVERGLQWLARQQTSDGSWSFRGPYVSGSNFENRESATAMALLAFLGAGHTQLSETYGGQVRMGLAWLCLQQSQDGSFGSSTPRHHTYYTHAQVSLALCEAFGITRDEWLHRPCLEATKHTVMAQGGDGGWRYEFQGDSDTSVTGWCLMALISARSASISVPDKAFVRVNRFIDMVNSDNGARYSYKPGLPATQAMTAEGLLCRIYLGWDRENKSLQRGSNELLQNHLIGTSNRPLYYWYYATQVMHHLGGEKWATWNASMKPVLLNSQVVDGPEPGSWDPADTVFDRQAARLYATCMSIYCLEVYYRHLPIYNSSNALEAIDDFQE
jgi:hypothetical protein